MSLNNVAIVYVKGHSHRVHFWYMSKDDAIMVLMWLIKGVFHKIFSIIYIFLLYIKISENTDLTYYQRKPRRKAK